jgi:hypothetical protein
MNDTQHVQSVDQMLALTRVFWTMPYDMACQLTQQEVPGQDDIYYTDNQVLGLSPLPVRLVANATSVHNAPTR